ncbi:AAA-domain-containing protein [Tilletiopsis washingtonensis]|uniref:AAA-domain-containing protein n=1 Tax=Tilletiopsis washingtonensis TaxID=58919 RepID=A0A316Z7Q4_9BASI|nr:AAA-domain-containing protein [Tilletiopsis washingtonensis]PWN97817.1 AAA-domain-containing protein [Tilletiopsis washingtonensis]
MHGCRILRVLSASLRLEGDFDFRALAKATPGYVGADLVALTAAAGILAVKRIFSDMGNGGPLQLEARTSQGDVEMAEQKETDAVGTAAAAVEPVPAPTPAAPSAVARATASFFEAMPAALANSSIATFLRTHPSALSASELAPLSITGADFAAALPSVQPSSQREGFATVPDVTWADVGALHETRDELCMAIVEPIRRPELFRAVGVSASSGVLLWGPPGCGKTLLAKAVANESGANFISVKGPELLNKYVGESERAVRQVFARARTSSPCVIFFDELDALVPRRDDALSESSSRVVNTLLTELDGLEARVQTYVIGATNRPDMIDPAMCRPGRLDKLLYVDLPRADERLEILRTLTTRTPLAADVDLEAVALDGCADGYSGADLAALTREAAVLALREALRRAPAAPSAAAGTGLGSESRSSAVDGVEVSQTHFAAALAKVAPSVSSAQRARYAALRTRLAGTPAGAGAGARAAKRAAADNGAERPRRFGGDGEADGRGEAPALA